MSARASNDAMDDCVVELDASWTIRHVNATVLRLLGRPADDLVGRSIWETLRSLEQSDFAAVLHEAMRTGEPASVVGAAGDRGRIFALRAQRHDGGLRLRFHEVTALHALEQRSREAADVQQRLRRVAVAVAAGAGQQAIFDLIAREVLELCDGQLSEIFRFEDGDRFTAVGTAGTHRIFEVGDSSTLTPGGAVAQQRHRRTPLAIEDIVRQPHLTPRRVAAGLRGTVLAPIVVEDAVWGAMSASRAAAWPGAADFARRLADFAELAGLAVASTEAKAQLARRATTDGLTDLSNSEALRSRVQAEIARARRHGGTLCLASLDVDNFKQINDRYGHEVGDDALRAVAAAMRLGARAEDLPARVGGDEFALLVVGAGRLEALSVVERIRRDVHACSPVDVDLRLSAGICEWQADRDDRTLVRLADDALYWAKVSGRDAAWIYDPTVVAHLDANAREELVRRNQALTGLQALARAIDAKDPTTREHSDRVADLARHLALAVGWPAARAALIHEAGLLHDVGKVGVPDAVLLKPGRLNADEYEAVKRHAALGAEIVGDVLGPEQVTWIRHHHERSDGGGYPDGIGGDEIPEGAAILAIADCWDAMTFARPYATPRPPAEALQECRRLAGRQFRADLVPLLEQVLDVGQLEPHA